MLTTCMGENVSPDYEPMMAEELAFAASPDPVVDPGAAGRFSVVVVGAGIIGTAIAFHLAQRGMTDVIVCDKGGVAGQASGRSGALVRTHYTNLDEARIALAALPWFEEWEERVGGDCGFAPTGFLQMVDRRDQQTLRRNVEALQHIGVDTRLVGPDEIRDLQPHLHLHGDELAAYEPRSGYADPVATTRCLAT
ncbi:MAG: FAD-dependent oxidoreductase, partial [Kiloniellaceae bacterium]|nr:FAD-dependent oxidoreductase [Kiloniellaceae bacterium]